MSTTIARPRTTTKSNDELFAPPRAMRLAKHNIKATGVIRQLDDLGRVVIPIEIRKRLGIGKNAPVEFWVQGNHIILGKPVHSCVFCGSGKVLTDVLDLKVCAPCRAQVAGEAASGS